MEGNEKNKVSFWIDNTQYYGRPIMVIDDVTLIEFRGRYLEIRNMEPLSERGYSRASLPEKWQTAIQPPAATPHGGNEPEQLHQNEEPGTQQPGGTPSIDLFDGNRESGNKPGLSVVRTDPLEHPTVQTPPDTQGATNGASGVLDSDNTGSGQTPNGPTSSLETEGGAGKCQESEKSQEPEKTQEPEKKRRTKEPRVKNESAKASESLLETDEREFEFTCPKCGEGFERTIKPNGEKGHWEISAGKKTETVTEHFFNTCPTCKETFAVKVVPVTVYVAKVAGF